jgi:hypothetical protein
MISIQGHALYAVILGIQSPCWVESVELQLESGEVHIRLAHRRCCRRAGMRQKALQERWTRWKRRKVTLTVRGYRFFTLDTAKGISDERLTPNFRSLRKEQEKRSVVVGGNGSGSHLMSRVSRTEMSLA